MAQIKVLKIGSEGVPQEHGAADDLTFNSFLAATSVSVSSGVSLTNNITFNDPSDTIAGIQNQNLLDKTAAETITNNWTIDTGYYLTITDAPTNDTDAANKAYVDAVAQGLSWQEPVLDKDLTAPPGGESLGDRYIVASPATGAWTGQEDNIAEWNGSSYDFTAVSEGFAVYVDDEDKIYVYNGTSWVPLGGIVSHNNLSGLQGGTSGQYYHLTSAEHTFLTGVVTGNGVRAVDITYTAGENLTASQCVYISGDNQVMKAIATSATTDKPIGFAVATTTSGNPVEVREKGIIEGALSGATAGTRYYLSASTAGGVQSTAPTGAGNRVVQVGFAKNADDLDIMIQYLGIRS